MAATITNSRHIAITVQNINNETIRLFTSYGVVVGIQHDNDLPIFTSEKFSATTNRHIRKFNFEHGGEIVNSGYFLSQVERWAPGSKVAR